MTLPICPPIRGKPPEAAYRLDQDGEFFLIPYLEGFLFYAPQLDTVALIDASLAAALRHQVTSDGLEAAALVALANQLKFPASWRDVSTLRPPKKEWAPTVAAFSNTQKCTLHCRYCYADGGRLDDADIDPVVAEAAIDLITQNARNLGARPGIIFLGEGEATANWEGFKHIIEYFRQRCADLGLTPAVSLTTNGVFAHSKVAYIAQNCDNLTFSIDGTAAAHDAQRVLPNGKGSFALIVATLREFDKLGKSYGIWTTATRTSAPQLSEFVQWVGENTSSKEVHIDPVFNMQGLAKTAEYTEDHDSGEFVRAYRLARRVAARFGITLVYTPSDIGKRTAFCGATNATNFLVTSKGFVTACNEVLQADDPRAELYQYGKWNAEKARFDFSAPAIERLSRLTVHEIPKCQACFAKYNCAGDCHARSTGGGTNPWAGDYTVRCSITRELLKDNLALSLLRTAETPAAIEASSDSSRQQSATDRASI